MKKPYLLTRCVILFEVNNVIYLKFYNKNKFPPGRWQSEPDYCKWFQHGLICVALRDMSLGIWKGFVGLDKSHPCFAKSVDELIQAPNMLDAFFDIYGGISSAGYLPDRYEEDAKKFWWLGCETSHGGDLYPLLKADPAMDNLLSGQTYKDLLFIRKETNKLARYVSRIK